MYLKLNNGHEDYHFYFPNSTVVRVGRSPQCEIQVVADGVSRIHIEIICQENIFYVVDKDSTNGTFINEKRLTGNIKTKINSFFPIVLGFHVTISLLDEANEAELKKLVEQTQKKLK